MEEMRGGIREERREKVGETAREEGGAREEGKVGEENRAGTPVVRGGAAGRRREE
jgi:hypothetical protein